MSWKVNVEMKPSTTHGTGVFATAPIRKGDLVWQFDNSMHACECGELLKLDRETLYRALLAGYLHEPSGKFIWYTDGMQFVNHADGDAANIATPEWLPLHEDKCIATRDIAPGEELFEDYGFWAIFNLDPGHLLLDIYRTHCPEHYNFMLALSQYREAA